MKKKNKIAIIPKLEEKTPAVIISEAIKSGSNLEQLEKLLAIRERFEANLAKKAYVKALAAFKCEVPDVRRDKKNSQYNNTYVSKGNLIKTITPVLSKFGLSVNFSYENLPDKCVKVFCRLTHEQGHSEETSFAAPADVSGAKNPIQQLKSTITYLEKITFAGILGIESLEECDDDGKAAGVPVDLITDKQVSELLDVIDNNNINKKKFLLHMGIDKLEDMKKADFKRGMSVLTNTIAERKK